ESLDRVAFWRHHEDLRARLVRRSRQRLEDLEKEHGGGPVDIEAAAGVLDPRALTIGFARRFATYKRAALIFHDPERLARLLHQPGRPVQLIFAGKAHPHDEPGKQVMQTIVHFTRLPEFRGKVVFLPGYGIGMARALDREDGAERVADLPSVLLRPHGHRIPGVLLLAGRRAHPGAAGKP